MPERIRFISPEEKKEREIAEILKKEGGIFYREEINPESGEVKRYVNILGVELETYASKEEIEAIKKEIVLSKVDRELLRTIAECYKLRQPLLIEGDPGVGKTFLMQTFGQLIGVPVLVLYGSPRISELDIYGHWAPASSAKESKDPIVQDTIRRYERLMEEYQTINDEYDQKYKKLKEALDSGNISQEEFRQKFEELNNWYRPLQERYRDELQLLWENSRHQVEWEFKEGALLQAYSGRDGKGCILIVDEFNLMPPNAQQIFLQIVGKNGALSDSISYFGNTGITTYPLGKDTWVGFAANFSEKVPGRSDVVPPMTDRLVWRSITPEEAETKITITTETAGGELRFDEELIKKIRKTFGSSLSFEAEDSTVPTSFEIEVPAIEQINLNLKENQVLFALITNTVTLLHRHFCDYYQKRGDRILIKGGARRRIQQLEFSGRNPLRLYSYLKHFQVRNPETGLIDFTKTLFNAFKRYYLDRLADPEAREEMERFFWEIMRGDTGKIEFEGKRMTREEALNILTERASTPPEVLEQQEKERRERELKEARDKAEGSIASLLDNPRIPESVKKGLIDIMEML